MYSNDELSIFESQAQFEELNQQCKAIANLPPDEDEGPGDEENMAVIVRASPYDDENAPLYKAYGISGKEINAKRGPIFSADEGRDLTKEEKLAIILGTEGTGLTPKTIDDCDYTVKIPMYNNVDSLNVGAAGAIAFWELGKKR